MDIDGEDNGPLMEPVDVPSDHQRGEQSFPNLAATSGQPWKSSASLIDTILHRRLTIFGSKLASLQTDLIKIFVGPGIWELKDEEMETPAASPKSSPERQPAPAEEPPEARVEPFRGEYLVGLLWEES